MAEAPFVRLLHISDLHFSSKGFAADVDRKEGFEERSTPLADTRDVVFRQLLKGHLDKVSKDQWPKAILVTGDLVDRGGTDGDEFRRARTFLIDLADDLGVPRKQVFVVPGNHDVTWTRGLSDEQKFAAYLDAMSEFTSPSMTNGVLTPEIAPLERIRGDINISLTLLVSPTYSGIDDPYGEKLLQMLDQKLGDWSEPEKKRIRDAVRDAHRTLDVSAIGTTQRQFVARSTSAPETIRIAMMHHHLLPNPQIELKSFEAVVDAGKTLQTFTRKGFDLVLHGHKHAPHLALYRDDNGAVHVYAAPSLFFGSPGFAFVDVFGSSGPHDIVLTQHSVNYQTGELRSEPPKTLDRDGRVLREVYELASEVPSDIQLGVIKPLLENLRKVLEWRANYPDRELFECLWEQVSFDVGEMGQRRVTFRPRYIDQQLTSLVKTIAGTNPTLRMVSEDDLGYWLDADHEGTPAFKYRTILRECRGVKRRIIILGPEWQENPGREYAEKLLRVVGQMTSDGFEVAIVRPDRVPKNVMRDFGIYGRTAVGLFEDREGPTRQLLVNFNAHDVRGYEEDWEKLWAAHEIAAGSASVIGSWLQTKYGITL